MTSGETVMSSGHGAAACVGGKFDWPFFSLGRWLPCLRFQAGGWFLHFLFDLAPDSILPPKHDVDGVFFCFMRLEQMCLKSFPKYQSQKYDSNCHKPGITAFYCSPLPRVVAYQ